MANYCFASPILPGGEQLMRKWIKENITNNADHDRVFRSAGISREQVWIEKTPTGALAVVCFEVKDQAQAFKVLGSSTDPWAVRFREFAAKAHGIDFSKPMPLNELISDWQDTAGR
jgi:hypothetical protein